MLIDAPLLGRNSPCVSDDASMSSSCSCSCAGPGSAIDHVCKMLTRHFRNSRDRCDMDQPLPPGVHAYRTSALMERPGVHGVILV